MKLLIDFIPIILFFTAFKFKGIYFATAIAIAAALIQMVGTYIVKRKLEPTMILSTVVLFVFGGFTLLLHNEMFVKWKPTILYWLFAMILAGSSFLYKKNLIKSLMQTQISVPEKIWARLNLYWIAFFSSVGVLNLFVAYHYETKIWVNFKLFGLLGCMILFLIFQSIMLARYIEKEPSDKPAQ